MEINSPDYNRAEDCVRQSVRETRRHIRRDNNCKQNSVFVLFSLARSLDMVDWKMKMSLVLSVLGLLVVE